MADWATVDRLTMEFAQIISENVDLGGWKITWYYNPFSGECVANIDNQHDTVSYSVRIPLQDMNEENVINTLRSLNIPMREHLYEEELESSVELDQFLDSLVLVDVCNA